MRRMENKWGEERMNVSPWPMGFWSDTLEIEESAESRAKSETVRLAINSAWQKMSQVRRRVMDQSTGALNIKHSKTTVIKTWYLLFIRTTFAVVDIIANIKRLPVLVNGVFSYTECLLLQIRFP